MAVKNVCVCHTPPGGTVACEPHQMALCIVSNGNVYRMCLDPPEHAADAQLVRWMVSKVTGIEGNAFDTINSPTLQHLLGGQWADDERIVNFALPTRIAAAVHSVIADRSSDHGAASSADM